MKRITARTIDDLTLQAAGRTRRRLNLNLHPHLADPVQRLLNAGEPDSYVRPHRHDDDRWELFCLLQGALAVITFAEDGTIASRTDMRPGGTLVVELPGGTWHSLLFLETASVLLEVKPGPYSPASDKDFADWAPCEGEAAAADLLSWMAAAPIGARWNR